MGMVSPGNSLFVPFPLDMEAQYGIQVPIKLLRKGIVKNHYASGSDPGGSPTLTLHCGPTSRIKIID